MALHRLVERVGDAVDAPKPDVIVLNNDWNAAAAVVGVRRTRVLLLGVPLLVGLTPQETVALIGHELGHFRWADSRRRLLTQPARTFFGVLATATRPPHGDAHDRELAGVHALFYTLWQVVGGAVSWLLFVVHLAMNTLDAREGRRAEVRADAMASSAAGSTAALSMIDVLVLSPVLALSSPRTERREARWTSGGGPSPRPVRSGQGSCRCCVSSPSASTRHCWPAIRHRDGGTR